MKTQPNLPQKPPGSAAPVSTDVNNAAQSTCERETQQISFTKVKVLRDQSPADFPTGSGAAPNPSRTPRLNFDNSFSYEKERLRAIQNTELFASLQSLASGPDVSILPLSALSSTTRTPLSAGQPTKKCDKLAQIQRIVSIALVLYAIANFIGAFFAILYISISNLPIVKYLQWIIGEFLLTAAFIVVSIKGHNVGGPELRGASWHLYRVMGIVIVEMCLLLIVALAKGLYSSLECAMGWNRNGNTYDENADAMNCVIVVSFFFSCMAKLLCSLLYLGLGVSLRMSAAGPETLAGGTSKSPSHAQESAKGDMSLKRIVAG